jgi:hypothetical protein
MDDREEIPVASKLDIEDSPEGRDSVRKLILPYMDKFLEVDVGKWMVAVAERDGAAKAGNKKQGEGRYDWDRKKLPERFKCGNVCEIATGISLGRDVLDPRLGNCLGFSKADLEALGVRAGVKGAKWRNTFPMPQRTSDPQIICTWDEGTKVRIYGIASPEVIAEYSHPFLVMDSSARDSKGGFYGFHKLFLYPMYNSPLTPSNASIRLLVLQNKYPMPKTSKPPSISWEDYMGESATPYYPSGID